MRATSTFQKLKHRAASQKQHRRLGFWQVWPLWLICGVLIALGVAALTSVILEGLPHKDDVPETRLQPGQQLRLALDKIEAGRVYLFSYPDGQSRRIRFVVQRTKDGRIHSWLASCHYCDSPDRPAYVWKGKVMCGLCNHPMPRPDEKVLRTGERECTMVSIHSSIESGKFIVSATDVLATARVTDESEETR